MMKLSELKINKSNPRLIRDSKYKKLLNSIREFPKMLELRPIIIDNDGTILGGNMRYRALLDLGYKEVPDEWVKKATDLTDEEKRRFVIQDNVEFGEWDYEMLANEWELNDLTEWGVELNEIKETEKISTIHIQSMYFEPKNINLDLLDCIDFEKFNKKIEIIENSNLTKEQKEKLKWFAYRFIRIDYEYVANYYYFKATEEEKRIIERLRLVLVDGGEQGFIEDELLKVMKLTIDEEHFLEKEEK